MQAPNAEQIEGAAENLAGGQSGYPSMSDFIREAQLKELQSAMGAETAKKLGLSFPLSEEAKTAYMLGVQTSRFVLANSAKLALARIAPEDLL